MTRRFVRRVVGAGAAAAAVLLSVSASEMAVPGTAELPITKRVFVAGELPGYTAKAPPQVVTSAKAYATLIGQPALSTKYQRAGFVRGAQQVLSGRGKAEAFMLLVEYPSASAARREVTRILADDRRTLKPVRPLAVPGIPGAKAFITDQYQATFFYFSDGRFLYNPSITSGGKGPPNTAALIRASRALYARVKGTGSGPSS
jgi:hypothetical protein